MLNYIWSGLIIGSLLFALGTDIHELSTDRFRNGDSLPVTLSFPEGYSPEARRQSVRVRLAPAAYKAHYGVQATPDTAGYAGVLVQTKDGRQVQFGAEASLPAPLADIKEATATEDNPALRGVATAWPALERGAKAAVTQVRFDPVRFRKLNDIAQAALSFAETAASLALSLIGVLALVLGLLKIGEEAGIIYSLTRVVQPVLRPLFPEVPKDHPALATVSLNLLANVFGLGNAATPLGIKAMEDLQSLNPSEHTATNAMVMLLAINTSSVQLVPPVLLIAIMGLQINQLVFSIILATTFSTIAGIGAAYVLSRWPRFAKSNPFTASPDPPADA
ncbi:nucleoside recognition domain-containing protein [Salisaeta longa]|uniref:nucleoside recognition domain-containing protein n=1 Tax=Salisaeta longa TaxID=503170 RepID=UPI0003B3E10D|nr:nucleoside recognition domain-containing protein [Salisaeta longa]